MEVKTHNNCPLCGSDKYSFHRDIFWEGYEFSYMTCRCGGFFLNPMPNQEWYDEKYTNDFWPRKTRKPRWFQWKKQIQKAEHFIKMIGDTLINDKPKVLDVGCSYGYVGRILAMNYGGRAYGIEPSIREREWARAIGVYMMKGFDTGEQTDKNLYDIVIISHVLENMVSPREFLTQIYNKMSPNGILIIDTPNIAHTKSWHIWHPYLFSRECLLNLVGSMGFHIMKDGTWGKIGMIPYRHKYLTVLAVKDEDTDTYR